MNVALQKYIHSLERLYKRARDLKYSSKEQNVQNKQNHMDK